MGAAVQGIVELLKVGGPIAVILVLFGAWAYERWQNMRNTAELVKLATAQIAAIGKVESMLVAQDKMLTMVLTRRGSK